MDENFESEWGELPGILNWAVEGLERLREDNHTFSGYPESSDRRIEITRHNWRAYAKSGLRWLDRCTAKEHSKFFPLSVAYSSYVEFCDREGIPPQSKRKFSQMVQWDDDVMKTKDRSEMVEKDYPVRGFKHIRLLDEWDPTKELSTEGDS